MASDLSSLVRRLRSAGYVVRPGRRRSHLQVRAADGGRLLAVLAATPGSSRSVANSVGDLRRAGVPEEVLTGHQRRSPGHDCTSSCSR